METRRLEIAADVQQLDGVRAFIAEACGACGLSGRDLASMRLAVDETCTNVVRHAYAEREGSLQIEVGARRGWLEVRIHDQGTPFDGRVEVAHLGRYIDARRKGGLGMFLVHKLVDEVRYRSTPAGNEWLLRKRLPRGASGLAPTLRRRYAMRVVAALAGAAGLIVTPLWVHEGRQRTRTELRALTTLAHGLAETARPVLLARTELSPEQTRLFEAVHAAQMHEPRLLAVHVVDAEGTIWAADRPSATFQRFLTPQALGRAGRDGLRSGFETLEGEPVLHLSVPVTLAGTEGFGEVHATLRWAPVREAIRNARWRLLLVAGALVAIACLTLAAWLGSLFRPMQRLVDAVRTGGANGDTLPTDMPAELGDLANAFNDVQARFRAAQTSLAEHDRLHQEMQVAREIQASILPVAPPEIPGFEIARAYHPAGDIGGDYYDFLALAPDMHGIVLADVAGKGVPAALVTAMLRTAVRMESRDSTQAAPVLARLHALLAPDLRKGMFVTMLYAVLDARHQTVSYASAGHTPMLLYRAASRETFYLSPRGLPVGIALDASQSFAGSLDVERVRLHPGDALLLYTDGITEAMNEQGEAYGEERLAHRVQELGAASASELVDGVLADVAAFRGSTAPSDDVTLVVLRERPDAPAAGSLRDTIRARIAREGENVETACRALGVSPATYHRFAATAADDATGTLLSVDKRARLRALVAAHPEMDVKQLAVAFATPAWGHMDLDADRVHAELRRLDLHTPERRAAFASEGAAPTLAPEFAAAPGRTPPHLAAMQCDSGALRAHCTPAPSDPRVGVVSLTGTVDSSSCGLLEPLLQRASLEHAFLAIDLGAVAYVSSRGWGLLASLQTQAAARAGAVAVCGMRTALADVYRMLGFERVLAAHASVDAALAAFTTHTIQPNPATPASQPLTVAHPPEVGSSLQYAIPRSTGERSGLQCKVGRPDGVAAVAVVALAGVVDTLHAYELERVLGDLVAQHVRHVVVDLSGVEFVSSAGWGSFTSHLPALRREGGSVRLFGMNREVARIHTLLHLDAVLPSYDVLAAALAATPGGAMPAVEPTPAAESVSLVCATAADFDLERDAALRRTGWEAYVALLGIHKSAEAA